MGIKVTTDSSLQPLLRILDSGGGPRTAMSLSARFQQSSSAPDVLQCKRLAAALAQCSSLRSLKLIDVPEGALHAVAKALEEGAAIEVLTLAGRVLGKGSKLHVGGLGPDLAQCNGWYLKAADEHVQEGSRWMHESGAIIRSVDGTWLLTVNGTRTFPLLTQEGRRSRVKIYYETSSMDALAHALIGTTRVHSLRLQGFYSMSPFTAELLGRSRTLKSLALMGRPCSGEVVEALLSSKTLSSLVLEGTHWNDKSCAIKVLAMLRSNATLSKLKFRLRRASERFFITSEVEEMWLQEVLQSNTTLRSLTLGKQGLPHCVRRLLRRNRGLRQWRALLSTAPLSADAGFSSLTSSAFRMQLLRYFLPPQHMLSVLALGRPRHGKSPPNLVAEGSGRTVALVSATQAQQLSSF